MLVNAFSDSILILRKEIPLFFVSLLWESEVLEWYGFSVFLQDASAERMFFFGISLNSSL